MFALDKALHRATASGGQWIEPQSYKRFESIVSDQVDWNIPASWGSCHVYVYGEAATTFDVVMMSSAN